MCQRSGNVDGDNEVTRFIRPLGLAVDKLQNLVYVIDGLSEGFNLRGIDMVTNRTDTLRSLPFNPSHCYISGNSLLITYLHGVTMLNVDRGYEESMNIGLANVSGAVDGWFSEATFHEPQGLAVVDYLVVLVADTQNNDIRLLNFNTKKAESLCGLGKDLICRLNGPSSLKVIQGTLYIGELRSNSTGIRTTSVAGI